MDLDDLDFSTAIVITNPRIFARSVCGKHCRFHPLVRCDNTTAGHGEGQHHFHCCDYVGL